MDITFNPPIGDSIQLQTSLSSRTVPLHFTAELTAYGYNKLVQDRARIQLWSDIPHDGQSLSDGEWSPLNFMNQAQATEEISSCKVSLSSSTYPVHTSEEKVTLLLEVVAALPMGHIPHFSFTYRIVYPSGDIKWLGAFGQNGSLSFERSDNDLRNFGLDSWTLDESKMASIYEIRQSVDTMSVAKVKNVCDYCVRAIGPTRFVSDLTEAALLFFIPRPQRSSISSSPTYVFSASPGASLALSSDGNITASGSGSLLFQVYERHLNPLAFIRQVLSHAELHSWNVLACDADSKAIVLATPKDKLPIKAVAIPLWHSKDFMRPICLETTTLSDILGSTEFSIFSPDNRCIHLFTVDPQAKQKSQMVSLQFDSTGNVLIMSPVYTLRGYQATTDKSAIIWKTVILSPYQTQDFPLDDSGILPTPPPSPHLQPIARLSQAHALCNTAMSSVPSLPSDTCIPLQSPTSDNDEPGTLPSTSICLDTDAFPIEKRSNSLIPRGMLTMFRSLFRFVFFGVFYRFFFGQRTSGPPSRDNTTDKFCASENLLKMPGTLEGSIKIQTTQARSSQSDAEIPETVMGYAISGVSRASDSTKGGQDVYYLKGEPSDSSSKKAITIALLCTTLNNSFTAEDTTSNPSTPSVMDENSIMERCVQFLDRSEPECIVRKCDIDVFCHGRVPGEGLVKGGSSSYSCCSLQYQLDWGSDLERTIRISPPSMT